MRESAATRFHFDVTPQAIVCRCHWNRYDQPAGPVVHNVDRYDDGWPTKRWLVADRLAEVDVIDFAPPDHARLPHS